MTDSFAPLLSPGEVLTLNVQVLDGLSDGVNITDESGQIVYANAAEEQLFAYRRGELVGNHIAVENGFVEDQHAARVSEVIAALESRYSWSGEWLNRARDGSLFHTQTHIVAAHAENRKYWICLHKPSRQATERELMLLIQASSALIGKPYSSDVLRNIIQLAQQFVAADAYAIWRRSDAGDWRLLLSAGLSDAYVISSGLVQNASEPPLIATRIFEDVQTVPELIQRRNVLADENVISMMVVPLLIRDGAAATMTLYWRTRQKFSSQTVRIAEALGNLAAAAMGTAELYEQQVRSKERAEQTERRAAFLSEAGAVLNSSLDYEETLVNVARLAVPGFADWCRVEVVDTKGNIQKIAIHHADPEKILLANEFNQKFPRHEQDPTTVAVRTGKSFLVEYISQDAVARSARNPEHLDYLRKLGLHSLIIVPMVLNGETLGVLSFVQAESGRCYLQEDLQVAEELARRAASAVAHARLYDEVRANEERLRLAINAASVGIWELDPLTQEMIMSDQCLRNLGRQPGVRITYDDLASQIHVDDRERWAETVNTALAQGSMFKVQHRLWWPDGSLHHLLVFGRSLSHNGKLLKTVGVIIDITEREALLARETQARRTAELLNTVGPTLLSQLDVHQLVQQVIDLATMLVTAQVGGLFYHLGPVPQGQIAFAFSGPLRSSLEEQVSSFQDVTPHKLITESVRIADLSCVLPSGAQWPLASFLQSDLGIRGYLAIPIRLRSGQLLGSLFFGSTQANLFTEEHEQIATGIAAQASIALENAQLFSDSKQAQEALRRSNDELQRVNFDLNQFAYSASHDLQEPLRMVAVYSQLLEHRYASQLDAKAKEYIGYSVQGAKRMEMLVKDLLAYTQAASSPDKQCPGISADHVLSKTLQNLETRLQENHATVAHTPLPSLCVDELHLLQLFQNTISNAVKYRRDSIDPLIEISCEREGQFCRMTIDDNGIGIPEEYRQQVFGLFKRLHHSDRYPGTGIGLAICQRLVERYGGRIWVDTKPTPGTRVCFTLPLAE